MLDDWDIKRLEDALDEYKILLSVFVYKNQIWTRPWSGLAITYGAGRHYATQETIDV